MVAASSTGFDDPSRAISDSKAIGSTPRARRSRKDSVPRLLRVSAGLADLDWALVRAVSWQSLAELRILVLLMRTLGLCLPGTRHRDVISSHRLDIAGDWHLVAVSRHHFAFGIEIFCEVADTDQMCARKQAAGSEGWSVSVLTTQVGIQTLVANMAPLCTVVGTDGRFLRLGAVEEVLPAVHAMLAGPLVIVEIIVAAAILLIEARVDQGQLAHLVLAQIAMLVDRLVGIGLPAAFALGQGGEVILVGSVCHGLMLRVDESRKGGVGSRCLLDRSGPILGRRDMARALALCLESGKPVLGPQRLTLRERVLHLLQYVMQHGDVVG